MSDGFDDIEGDIPLDKLKGVAGGSGKSHHAGLDEEDSVSTSHSGDGYEAKAHADAEVKTTGYSYQHSNGETQASATVGVDATASASAEAKTEYSDVKASGSVEVLDGATGEIHSDKEDSGFSAKAGSAVEAKGEVDSRVGTENTNVSASAKVDAKMGTEAKADGDVYHGHGHYGAKGSAGAFDDAGVKVSSTVGGEVDGTGGTGTVGASVGETGVGGSFDGEYHDHELKFGLQGAIGIDICGVKVGFSAEINTKPFEHAAKETSHWLSGAGQDIGHSFQDLGHNFSHNVKSAAHDIEHDAKHLSHEAVHTAQHLGHEAEHAAKNIGHEAEHTAKHVSHTVSHTAKSAGHAIKHAFSGW
ncbi:MAG: hypothetical protein HRU21_04395 [Pseudomonadales bacterium]|nr:hypothetical protein [Pseudomonadales bacterium]